MQTILVYAIVAVAALYAGYKTFQQFIRSDDQPACSKCAQQPKQAKMAAKSHLPLHILKAGEKKTVKDHYS
ncbi:MAG: hypothetical protein D6814_15385 [Calditrichaeota bacterium]|nr:MAG: hypothetical protein D6814_15385 [Calditrichota bacterium]